MLLSRSHADSNISRPGDVASMYGRRGADVLACAQIPGLRTVRIVLANATSICVDAIERCGGLGSWVHEGLHEPRRHRGRFARGARNLRRDRKTIEVHLA